MARQVEPQGGGTLGRVLVVLAVVVLLWFVVNAVLGTVFAVVRGLLLLALFGVVAWVVLVGPPGGRD
jgi:hypothetical protein